MWRISKIWHLGDFRYYVCLLEAFDPFSFLWDINLSSTRSCWPWWGMLNILTLIFLLTSRHPNGKDNIPPHYCIPSWMLNVDTKILINYNSQPCTMLCIVNSGRRVGFIGFSIKPKISGDSVKCHERLNSEFWAKACKLWDFR